MNLRFSIKKEMQGIFVFTLALALTAFVAACKRGNMSPTETLKAYDDAMARYDVGAAKKYLSRYSMQTLEKIAKNHGETVDQIIEENSGGRFTHEYSNEKINGDTATVDIKSVDPKSLAPPQLYYMRMVKEDGVWKVGLAESSGGVPIERSGP